jgi:hypothetical protein
MGMLMETLMQRFGSRKRNAMSEVSLLDAEFDAGARAG